MIRKSTFLAAALAATAVVAGSASFAAAGVATWTGAGNTDTFPNGANWSTGTAVTSGSFAFGPVVSGGNTTAVDDEGNGINPSNITFNAGTPAMTIDGSGSTNTIQIVFAN